MNELVSILLPVFNGADTITRCISSITAQTYRPLELICIDDASTDESIATVRSHLQKHPDIAYQEIRHAKNAGLAKSLNESIQRARGSYIARIDADDWWEPEKLQLQVKYLDSHPECGVIGSWYINHRASGKQNIRKPISHKDITGKIYRENPFGHSCVVMRADVLRHVGCYDESIRFGQDYDLWLRLFPRTTFYNLPQYVCHRRVRDDPAKQQKQMKQMITTLRKHGVFPQAYGGILTTYAVLYTPSWIKRLRRALW